MLSWQLVSPRNVPVSACIAVEWRDTLPHPAAPRFRMGSGGNTLAPRLEEWAQPTNNWTREMGRSHWDDSVSTQISQTDLYPYGAYTIHHLCTSWQTDFQRKEVFLTIFVLLYPFLFAFWISTDCASVKKSLFKFFALTIFNIKWMTTGELPTISAKSNWVDFKWTNSVHQKAYHKYTHFESMHGQCNFTEETLLYSSFSLHSPIHSTLGYQMHLKEERGGGTFSLG